MARKAIRVGLDPGTTKVAVVIGEEKEGKVQVIGYGEASSKGFSKGMVVDVEGAAKAIDKAVKQAEEMAGVKVRDVLVSISGPYISGHNTVGVITVSKRGGEIPAKDRDRAIQAAISALGLPPERHIIHVLPQEYVVDGHGMIKNPVGMVGTRLEAKVHVITAGIELQSLVKSVQSAGLNVLDLVFSPLASSVVVLTDTERELGTALVDIGGGTTEIVIFQGNKVQHSSVIDFGGEMATNDVAKVLRTPMEDAEELKKRYGTVLPSSVQDEETVQTRDISGMHTQTVSRRYLAEILEARMGEIFGMIKEDIERSGYRSSVSLGLVITGGSSSLKGMAEMGERMLDLPVRIGYPKEMEGLRGPINSPSWTTALGLVNYGLEEEDTIVLDRVGIWDRIRDWFMDIFKW
jgi:cell division protein FtsA